MFAWARRKAKQGGDLLLSLFLSVHLEYPTVSLSGQNRTGYLPGSHPDRFFSWRLVSHNFASFLLLPYFWKLFFLHPLGSVGHALVHDLCLIWAAASASQLKSVFCTAPVSVKTVTLSKKHTLYVCA